MEEELARSGEGGDRECHRCASGDEGVLWRKAPWILTPIFASANPVGLFLEAAMRAQPSAGRVHIHRFADGSSHFHVWFQGRPARQLELYGWGNNIWANNIWAQVLPPLPDEVIATNHAAVLEAFAASYRRELA